VEQRTVLIAGASIAGPALAFWLAHYGFRPVIVERADSLRLGGQNIDIQGTARQVVRRMGIEDDIRAATTGELGLRFVDAHNVTQAEFPAGHADSDGFTKELEILRGDLAKILYDRTRTTTEYIFGNQITSLHDHGDRVTVAYKDGAQRDFDLVIAADGIRSRTRTFIVGDEPRIRSLGLYASYFTIPRSASDSAWARWYHAPRSRSMLLRPTMWAPPGSRCGSCRRRAAMSSGASPSRKRSSCNAMQTRVGKRHACSRRWRTWMTFISTPSARSWRHVGPTVVRRSWVTRPTVRRRSAVWGRASHSSVLMCWRQS
jgi:2-polyprenyl-6-methoxyphenol hydroxylase-like FAD-dependent oxidoreductase